MAQTEIFYSSKADFLLLLLLDKTLKVYEAAFQCMLLSSVSSIFPGEVKTPEALFLVEIGSPLLPAVSSRIIHIVAIQMGHSLCMSSYIHT